MRWFSSKGAYLVLLWTLLFSFVSSFLYSSLTNIALFQENQLKWLRQTQIAVALVSAPLSGWLADAKFGNYKVFRAGTILLFISAFFNCLLLILETNISNKNHVLKLIHLCTMSSILMAGICACAITALPLSLDQMPDASSSSIASYIAWFVCSFFVGKFLEGGIKLVIDECMEETVEQTHHLLMALFVTICMSVGLSTIFACSPKWLIIEPKSPQSFKTIYQILKFAIKHKAPLSRSAFTYWEGDIPSRIYLAKTKYGGPFTTEQVEDVKTVLRLIAMTLTFILCVPFLFIPIYQYNETFPATTNCEFHTYHFLLDGPADYSILGTLTYEFLVYPFFKNKLPSILKRIGAALLVVTLISFVCFVLKLTHFLSHSSETTTGWIVIVLYYSAYGFLMQVLLTSFLEFMCAQSPYNMRGLLLSVLAPLIIISSSLSFSIEKFISDKIVEFCTKSKCSFILF